MARAWHQGHHGVRGLLTAILKQLDLPHSFALLPKFEAGKPGDIAGRFRSFPYSGALPEFSGRRDNPVVNAGLNGAILCPAGLSPWSNFVVNAGLTAKRVMVKKTLCQRLASRQAADGPSALAR